MIPLLLKLIINKNSGLNVLSLFDGMSCGQIALERANIRVNKYYASEIDKYAIKVTQANYPNTIQLGDVTQVKGSKDINLLIGGSPCQGFSFAGKQLNFNDPRSALFFEFVRIKKECGDCYFLLENVKMKKEYQDIISSYLGVEPVEINSALVSAQNRKRLYWTNIPDITQPDDKGVLLKDIIDKGWVDRDKCYCIDAHYQKGNNVKGYLTKKRKQIVFNSKSQRTLVCKLFNTHPSGKGMNGWVYDINCKAPTITTNKGEGSKIMLDHKCYRKLTPIECERLQTVPDDYTNHVSNTQRYKMLGNGWTIDVIAHIFNNIN